MVVIVNRVRRYAGIGLVELLVATAIGAFLLGALVSVARLGAMAREQTRSSTEAVQQARFALERIVAAARATAPHSLLAPPANTSGDWFGSVYFCVNGSQALVESTSTDTSCTGTRVIADRVSAFVLSVPADAGPLSSESVQASVTVAAPDGSAVTLTERLRLGGATL